MSRILIIEDDPALADVVAYNLRQAGHEVTAAYDGRDGLAQAELNVPEIILLDLMLPILDGLEVCRRLRANARMRETRIVILTAKTEEADQLRGFSLGADDYVTKPFSISVLLERLKALERRRARGPDADVVSRAGITVDRRRYQVTVGDRRLPLTRSQFRLLDTLIRQPDRAFSRSELISLALGDDALVTERIVDVHIASIRRELGEAGQAIETVRGVGYRFRNPNTERKTV